MYSGHYQKGREVWHFEVILPRISIIMSQDGVTLSCEEVVVDVFEGKDSSKVTIENNGKERSVLIYRDGGYKLAATFTKST